MAKKKTEWQPKVQPAPVVMPGRREAAANEEDIPQLTGPTAMLNLRIDQATADIIQEHFDRLWKKTGMVPSRSDAVRSLIFKGAEAFREDDE
jgi:hypothetical protein